MKQMRYLMKYKRRADSMTQQVEERNIQPQPKPEMVIRYAT